MMSSILHRQTINAAPEHVQDLVATKKGIEPWWTGQPVDGNDSVGGEIAVSFGDRTAATFQITERTPERVVWRCVSGPHDWIDTRITFTPAPRPDGGTTLRFRHEGWQEETDLMYGCSTNSAAYLISLKSGTEGRAIARNPEQTPKGRRRAATLPFGEDTRASIGRTPVVSASSSLIVLASVPGEVAVSAVPRGE